MRKLLPLLTVDAGSKIRMRVTCKQFTDKAATAWKSADMGIAAPSEAELSKAYELIVMAMTHQAVSEGLNVDDLSREDLFQLAHRSLHRVRPQLDKLLNGWVPSDKKAPEAWYSL